MWLEEPCLDLLLVSYNNILKKKDANVQVKLKFFYFLEKDRKSGTNVFARRYTAIYRHLLSKFFENTVLGLLEMVQWKCFC